MRVRGARWRPGRAGRHRRGPVVAAGLALAAAALTAAVPSSGTGRGPERAETEAEAPPGARARGPAVTVSAPVRIADAGAVRLLRPGDRVDVVAARADGRPGVRVLASGARVTSVPEEETPSGQPGETAAAGGSLVVLSVARGTAARLAGVGATSRLAVTLW
ncbi:RcpC/CpaB family pilus assembly protein [Streptomyces sp. YJ-C3]